MSGARVKIDFFTQAPECDVPAVGSSSGVVARVAHSGTLHRSILSSCIPESPYLNTSIAVVRYRWVRRIYFPVRVAKKLLAQLCRALQSAPEQCRVLKRLYATMQSQISEMSVLLDSIMASQTGERLISRRARSRTRIPAVPTSRTLVKPEHNAVRVRHRRSRRRPPGWTPMPRAQRVYKLCARCGEKNHVRRLCCRGCYVSKAEMGVGAGTETGFVPGAKHGKETGTDIAACNAINKDSTAIVDPKVPIATTPHQVDANNSIHANSMSIAMFMTLGTSATL